MIGRAGGTRQQAAVLAGDESGLGGGLAGRRHPPTLSSDGTRPLAHSMRFQASRGSNVMEIAARRTTSAPTAYIPIPTPTDASSAILIKATRMPRIITSPIDQGCIELPQRSSSPTQCGAGGRLTAIR